jgi:hypothetical protein
MKDAMATTTNFSANEDIKSKMIVLMEELQKCLLEYSINDSDEKGGNVDMNNEEIMEATVEETEVEESTSEVEVVMEENTEEPTEETEVIEEEVVAEESTEDQSPSEEVDTEEFSEGEIDVEPLVCSFRISHDDTRYGLQSLLNAMCDDSHFYSVLAVYDKYFYYCDYFSGDAFKQAYKVRKDVVSFSGDPEPVFTEFVTQAERDELEKLRKDYVELKEFKENVEASVLKAQKDAIFTREEYSVLADDEAFNTLQANAINFSVEEVETKVKAIFADHVIKTGEFSVKKEEKKSKTLSVNFEEKESKKKKAYGKLFD